MKLELSPTSDIVCVNGYIMARVWQGSTDTGIPIQALILRVAVPSKEQTECERFSRELQETPAPHACPVIFDPRIAL